VRHSKLDTLKLYFEKFKQKFKKKDNRSKIIINNIDKNNFIKKRSAINIKIDFEYYLKFFKKNYIPYYFIISIILVISIVFIIF